MSDEVTTEAVQDEQTAENLEIDGGVVPAAAAADSEPDEDGPVFKQAARFRKLARELETELAAAVETITSLRRERAESLAAEFGLKSEALWATTELDGLLSEDGSVNPERVKAAVDDAVSTLDVRLRPTGGLRVPEERGSGTTPPPASGKSRWDRAFKPSTQR